MSETEAGRDTGARDLPPRGVSRPAHAAEPGRRANGIATALAEPLTDSTTILPRIPADGDPAALPEPAAVGAPPQPRRRRTAEPDGAAPPAGPPGPTGKPAVEKPAAEKPAVVGPSAVPVAGPARPPRLRGVTALGADVVEKVVGFAAEQVDGVFDLGGDVSRSLASIRERIHIGEGTSRRGVHVELAGHQARVTLTLVIQFGHPAVQVAEQVRENVIAAVEMMLAMDVTECNVIIDDIHVGD